MKGRFIKAIEIEDGDIFYTQLSYSMDNDHLIGDDFLLTGTDVILIADDTWDNPMLVNGGHLFWYDEDTVVFKIGHYSNIVKKMGGLK